MKWTGRNNRLHPYSHEQSSFLHLGASLNRGRRNGNLKNFMRCVGLIWVLAFSLLVRSAWLSFQMMSTSTSENPQRTKLVVPVHHTNSKPDKRNASKRKSPSVVAPKVLLTVPNESVPLQELLVHQEDNSKAINNVVANLEERRGDTPSSNKRREATVLQITNTSGAIATVAHAISFLSCGASLTAKYKDAMLVLRHSIHQNSILAQNSTSRYAYKMYAFVNNDPSKKCSKYTAWIQRMGYTPLLLPNPVNISAIENKYFRETIDRTGVAGSSELIKLYLYTLTDHPIVVHWDIDIIVLVRTRW